jgi:hypothetical protein
MFGLKTFSLLSSNKDIQSSILPKNSYFNCDSHDEDSDDTVDSDYGVGDQHEDSVDDARLEARGACVATGIHKSKQNRPATWICISIRHNISWTPVLTKAASIYHQQIGQATAAPATS